MATALSTRAWRIHSRSVPLLCPISRSSSLTDILLVAANSYRPTITREPQLERAAIPVCDFCWIGEVEITAATAPGYSWMGTSFAYLEMPGSAHLSIARCSHR